MNKNTKQNVQDKDTQRSWGINRLRTQLLTVLKVAWTKMLMLTMYSNSQEIKNSNRAEPVVQIMTMKN